MRKTVNIKKTFLAAGIFLLQGLLLSAQSITITLDKDTIGFSETVVLRLTAEGKDFTYFAELPQADGLQVISHTNNFSMSGSGDKIKFTQTFTLSPYKVGTFTIGPAWVQTRGNRIFSNKVKLVVKAGSQTSMSNEIFMRCEPDKKKAVVGEQITLAIRIYSRVHWVPGEDHPITKTFNGFWYHQGTAQLYQDTGMLINGFRYRVTTFYKDFVFPNTVGKLTIPSYEYACFIKQNPFPTGDPMVDDVMGIQMPVQLVSPEFQIEVLPLPDANKPAGFSGDVGKFSLSASIDRENVKVNEAVTLTVTISGKGNISFVQLPALKFPADIESYPPSSTDSTLITEDGLEGNKTFTITLIPKKEGVYTFPEVSFFYFDETKKEYITIKTPEFKLNVAPGDGGQDVSENNLPESFLSGSSYGKIIERILWILIPAVLLIVLLYYRSQRKNKAAIIEEEKPENAEEPDTFPVKSKPDIYSMMQVAERFIVNGRTQSGIAQLYETLLSAALFKTELSREEASIHQLRYRLGIKNIPQEIITETINLLEELSTQRYSAIPTDSSKLSANLLKTRKLSLELVS
ncbi:MAG: BatD family protein [Bacteroidota bacterium]|nr:BatD family protein [Bacteroidota bacterium]